MAKRRISGTKKRENVYDERFREMTGTPYFEENLKRIKTKKVFSSTFDRKRQNDFLKHYASSGNLMYSLKMVGVSHSYFQRLLLEDSEFCSLFEEAKMFAADMLEYEARRRAVDGIPKAVWHDGEIAGFEQQYSDSLLTTLLKANIPDKFKTRNEIDLKNVATCSFAEMVDYLHRRDDGEDVSEFMTRGEFGKVKVKNEDNIENEDS